LEYGEVQRINHRLRPLFRIDQPRLPEDGEMMGNGRFRQTEFFRNFARAQISFFQHHEDFPPRLIAHRFPHVPHSVSSFL